MSEVILQKAGFEQKTLLAKAQICGLPPGFGGMTTSKPTIVIVPGACHTPYHWADLILNLQDAGYPVDCKQMASVDSADPAACNMHTDIVYIQQQVLQPLVDKSQDILLVCHSAAGLAGGAAALGHSKTEQSVKGQKGGIVGTIFVAAFLAFQGLPSFSKLADGAWPADFNVNVRH